METLGYQKLNEQEEGNSVDHFNLIWESDTNCDNDFRSHLLGKPMYDMKCNRCLSFVGSYHCPEDCKVKYCSNCGQKIQIKIIQI